MVPTNQGTEPSALLKTKLNRPCISGDLIARPHLLERLNQGLNRMPSVTLISAPAGFGKTTLACTWLQDVTRPVAWLSLDSNDSHLLGFLSYLVAAIQTVFPDACPGTQRLWESPQLPPLDHVAATLTNDLADLPENMVLVLDDYHLVQDEAVHTLMTRLLDYLPAQIHLVLICRTDPPLPLARLRVRQQLTEIRRTELHFTTEEVGAYLERSLGRTLPEEAAILLQERTEGWVAGLRLAVLSMRDLDDPTVFIERFKGSHRHVMAYLTDEVLSQQSQEVQDFLLRTSVLNRFCAPLCDAVLDGGNDRSTSAGGDRGSSRPMVGPPTLARGPSSRSQKILAWLDQANLFVVPMDYEGVWYRYHHLFQELLVHRLRQRVSSEELRGLHHKASLWLADNGFIGEAIHHALAADDAIRAAQLVEEHRHHLLNRGQWRILERWLAMIPGDLVHQRPGLLVAKAWIHHNEFTGAAIPPLLEEAGALLDSEAVDLEEGDALSLRGEIDGLRGQFRYWQGEGERSLADTTRALARIPTQHKFVRGEIMVFQIFAYQMVGQTDRAVRQLNELLVADPALAIAMSVPQTLSFVHLVAGDLNRAVQVGHSFLGQSVSGKRDISLAWTHYILGLVYYEWNQLDAAAHHFETVVKIAYGAHSHAYHDSVLGLALTYQAQGRPDQAWRAVEEHLETGLEKTAGFTPSETRSFQARLSLMRGELEPAVQWLGTAAPEFRREPMIWLETPRLTQARVLLAQGTHSSLKQATSILQELRQLTDEMHNTRRAIEILGLLALVHQARGAPTEAWEALKRALSLAQPGGFVRTFVDCGPPMAGLLYQLAERGTAPDYVGRLLDAFEAGQPRQRAALAAQAKLVEPLTERELEVLDLLNERLSDKEIAQQLVVSYGTVKKHTSNIYQKLAVNSRRQAVAKAKTLGILSP